MVAWTKAGCRDKKTRVGGGTGVGREGDGVEHQVHMFSAARARLNLARRMSSSEDTGVLGLI
jgi:hypothetical protein